MKTVREVLSHAPVWVNPDHTTESAVVLLRGHGVGALPVISDSKLVGMVLYSQVLGTDPAKRVGDLMTADVPSVAPDMSVREATDLMIRSGLGHLPVVEGERLVGILSDSDLLPELGRSYDPMTGLPWTDSLREWAIEHLKRGAEITVLFIDLNEFGRFNKVYGHIVGDEVLQSVARVLQSLIDDEIDFLCRYGGDEFCIATLRTADDAAELADRANARIGEIEIPAAGEEHISSAVGQFGGKRTKEREHVHYAATLNSLINLASRDATAQKGDQKGEPSRRTTPPPPRLSATESIAATSALRLERIEVTRHDRVAQASVELTSSIRATADGGLEGAIVLEGATRYTATGSAETSEEGTNRLVAETTLCALRSILPDGYDLTITDVIQNLTAYGQRIVTVAGLYVTPIAEAPIAGSAVVGTDPYTAVANAVLSAVNPILARSPG